jgi:hypothetical protein
MLRCWVRGVGVEIGRIQIDFEYLLVRYLFLPDTNMDLNILEYKYKLISQI